MTVVVRVLRVGLGALMLLVAMPLMLAGGGLWLVSQHRHDGAFTAHLERTRTDGRAIVVSDVDALLRRDVPFARGGQTTLRVAARTEGKRLFLGLAQESDVHRYLDGAPFATVTRVRLARGPLPVDITPAATSALEPADSPKPAAEGFWIRSGDDALAWSPSSVRGRRLAIVVMNADGSAGVDVTLTARLAPAWVSPTSGGLMIGGTALFLLGLLAAAWPSRRRRSSGVPAEALDPDAPALDEDAQTPPPTPLLTRLPRAGRPRFDQEPLPRAGWPPFDQEPLPRAGRPRCDQEPLPPADRPRLDQEPLPRAGQPEPGDAVEGHPQVTVEGHPQVTKEPQSAATAPDGPPQVLPPVNLRLTWPALPGTRQKEDLKG